ncbi:MAG: hypothetical protein GF393_10145 [Armatimonadia bacterium]|nr:hypothetical protein [Armatimonadia bacterium]
MILSRSINRAAEPPEVAVQLRLMDGFSPTARWVSTLSAFSLRTIPDLDANSLIVADSAGSILYEEGSSMVPAATPPAGQGGGLVDETFRFEPGWLWAASGLGFLLVVGGLAVQLLLRGESEPEGAAVEAGPLDFLETVPADRIVAALHNERPQVVAAVVGLAPHQVAERLRRHDALPEHVSPLTERPAPDLTEALARELRARLVGS